MTIVSNDPIWWPIINYCRVYSYFSGLWRASGFTQFLTTLSQLYPSLWWYTIGVGKTVLIERIVDDVPAFSSTDIWTRGRLMPVIIGTVISLKMGSIA
jgi:hypothetical protein